MTAKSVLTRPRARAPTRPLLLRHWRPSCPSIKSYKATIHGCQQWRPVVMGWVVLFQWVVKRKKNHLFSTVSPHLPIFMLI